MHDAPPSVSTLAGDETCLLFDTAAHREGDRWLVPFHAWVYELEDESRWRRGLLSLLRRRLGIPRESEQNSRFRRRAARFLVDNERGERIVLATAAGRIVVGPTGADGHAFATHRLSASALPEDGWIELRAVLPEGDERRLAAAVELVPPRGMTVVSDLDDTVKISEVHSRRRLLRRTFLEEWQPVPGMAEAYRRWQGHGAVFHYLTASPWQLGEELRAFLDAAGFPRGPLAMRKLRWKDESFWSLFAQPEEHKRTALADLFTRFPRRQFVLVGDSGERDAEIYAALARTHPERVHAICIRLLDRPGVEDARAARARLEAVLDGVPARAVVLFTEAADLGRVAIAH